ncbi:MAG: hypothetical protein AB7P40_24485 [Chloroflexota bacterium]
MWAIISVGGAVLLAVGLVAGLLALGILAVAGVALLGQRVLQAFRIGGRRPVRDATSRPPDGVIDGDSVGRGEWTLRQDGPTADIVYDWQIRADKPLLKWFSPILKPIFSANHRWAMARGEESLVRELERRRGVALSAP